MMLLTVVSQPNTKMVMATLDRRDLMESNSDLTTVRARELVLRRKLSGARVCWSSPSVLSMAYCQRPPEMSQPLVKMI